MALYLYIVRGGKGKLRKGRDPEREIEEVGREEEG